eukprot:scaffold15511_cov51-Phaeocystis_antarctica.AAC.2
MGWQVPKLVGHARICRLRGRGGALSQAQRRALPQARRLLRAAPPAKRLRAVPRAGARPPRRAAHPPRLRALGAARSAREHGGRAPVHADHGRGRAGADHRAEEGEGGTGRRGAARSRARAHAQQQPAEAAGARACGPTPRLPARLLPGVPAHLPAHWLRADGLRGRQPAAPRRVRGAASRTSDHQG